MRGLVTGGDALIYAGISTVLFLIYLLWMADVRDSHEGEEGTPWLQYTVVSIVMGVVSAFIGVSIFFGLITILIVLWLIPPRFLYYCLAALCHGFIVLVIILVQGPDGGSGHASMRDAVQKVPKRDRYFKSKDIDKSILFSIKDERFSDATTIRFPIPDGYTVESKHEVGDGKEYISYVFTNESGYLVVQTQSGVHSDNFNSKVFEQALFDYDQGILERKNSPIATFFDESFGQLMWGRGPFVDHHTSKTVMTGTACTFKKDDTQYDLEAYFGGMKTRHGYIVIFGHARGDWKTRYALFASWLDKFEEFNRDQDDP